MFDRTFTYVYNAFDYDELYDLENDPHETHNLRGQPGYEGVIRGMWEKLWCFAWENQDDISNGYTVTAMQPYGPGIIDTNSALKERGFSYPRFCQPFSRVRKPALLFFIFIF